MTFLESGLLGVIEGLTEFLPISSTGHLILASSFLGIAQTPFVKTFEIAIQSGAILAVVALYWRALLEWSLIKKIIAGFLPTAVIGLAFYQLVKTYLIGNAWVVVAALALGGIALIAFEKLVGQREHAKDLASLSYVDAALIGFAQAVAIIPGVSRSAATVLGGLSLGYSRPAIVEFSFLLAIPTMLAATGLDLFKTSFAFSSQEWITLGIGFAVSFFVALGAIRWLLSFVRRRSFVSFGVYRILLALITAVWLIPS